MCDTIFKEEKMKKRIISVLLAASMVVALVGCGGSNASSDPSNDAASAEVSAEDAASLKEAAANYDLDKIVMVCDGTLTATIDNGQAEFEKQWEDAVGVDLEIQQQDHSGYSDAVGRIFASGDYPDVILLSANMYAQYAPTGILWDMTAAYDNADFQARMKLADINESHKIDGKLFGLSPAYGNGCVSYVKKAWLDALNIDPNTITDYASYYNMLKRFHEEDPDGNGVNGDTYGVIAAGYIGPDAPWVQYLPEFWQDAYPDILPGDDGVWYDGFTQDNTKAALLRMRDAYNDGVIDPETFDASTKTAREKWFSNDQTGSAGVFTYWAGTWYQTLTDNLVKNGVDSELVMLKPIAEVGAYLNRESPVWCIIDKGDPVRQQAIFDKFFETMLDGDKVQTLWTYGAEGVHWSTEAETFKTNAGTDNEKEYTYAEGEFHLKQSPNDPDSVWKKNAWEAAFCVAPLTNGYASNSSLADEGNKLFTENCKDAPTTPSSETYTNEAGTINDAKAKVIAKVIVEGGDVDEAMAEYTATVGSIIEQILTELNAESAN